MTDEQRQKIKERFEEGKYDVACFIVDNDLVTINLETYESFCDEIISILNKVRINRDLLKEEIFYPYEELFANDFHRSVYRAIKKNENLDELSDDVLDKLKHYYWEIKNVSSIGVGFYEEEEFDNEKAK